MTEMILQSAEAEGKQPELVVEQEREEEPFFIEELPAFDLALLQGCGDQSMGKG